MSDPENDTFYDISKSMLGTCPQINATDNKQLECILAQHIIPEPAEELEHGAGIAPSIANLQDRIRTLQARQAAKVEGAQLEENDSGGEQEKEDPDNQEAEASENEQ